MRVPVHLIPGLAALLRYPGPRTAAMAAGLADAAMETAHPCQEHLEAFALSAATLELPELQEHYTRSFDLNPECSLEIGWHLFGESYKRGQFLAMMRFHLREHGIEPGAHLPDHLPALLELVMKLESQDAMDLVDDCILPALEKVLPALKDGVYAHLLQALFLLFTAHRTSSGGDRPDPPVLCVPPGAPHDDSRQGPSSSSPAEVSHA
ncbi:MAG: molecular chaperone TorD family protein [Acidobacteria bacterium]|nr:molecular chaperone TorD family protein [Acidobacteriota bacterium]